MLFIQAINNNGIRFYQLISVSRGTGVPGTTVSTDFILSLIIPISTGSMAAVWLQSTGFDISDDGMNIISTAGCQLRLGQSATQERKHYLGIERVIGLM